MAKSTTRAALSLRELSLRFGRIPILQRVNAVFGPGELVLIRGENGVGKSALLNVLSGFLRPSGGSVDYIIGDSRARVPGTAPDALARFGVGRLWQDVRLFPSLSVFENVLTATPELASKGLLSAVAVSVAQRHLLAEARRSAHGQLLAVGLTRKATDDCDGLSLGELKLLALARLLQMRPAVLLLDEPLAGMADAARRRSATQVKELCDAGAIAVIVEHGPNEFLPLATRQFVLEDRTLKEQQSDG